jgi:uncharacterized protein YcnI
MRNKMLLTAALVLAPLSAFAHVSLADNTAAPGAQVVAHFRVGHGCSGSPTTGLRIVLPAGVSGVVPQPQAGWKVETAMDGGQVKAVTYTGGSLAADTKGEFLVAMTLPAKTGLFIFPATQTCASGSEEWSDAPDMKSGVKSTHPAPVLYVGEPAPKQNGMAPGMVMPDGSRM